MSKQNTRYVLLTKGVKRYVLGAVGGNGDFNSSGINKGRNEGVKVGGCWANNA